MDLSRDLMHWGSQIKTNAKQIERTKLVNNFVIFMFDTVSRVAKNFQLNKQ